MSDDNQTQDTNGLILPHQKELVQSTIEKGILAAADSSTHFGVDQKVSSGSAVPTPTLQLPPNQQVQPRELQPKVPVKVGDKEPGSIRSICAESGEELDLRITEDSTGKCIRVAYYAGDQIRKVVWEPARTWSRN